MSSRLLTRKLLWLAAALVVAVVSLVISWDYFHTPLAFFPFFLLWSWPGRRSQTCRKRPEYGTCAPHTLLADEDPRG